MKRELRWTERATEQLAVIAEYISITSPVYAEQIVERIAKRLEQAQVFPESGRVVPEARSGESLRELIERPPADPLIQPRQPVQRSGATSAPAG